MNREFSQDDIIADDETTSVVQSYLEHNGFLSDEFNDIKYRYIQESEVVREDIPVQRFVYRDSNVYPSWITKSSLWESKSNQDLDGKVEELVTIPAASRDALQNQNMAMWLMKNWLYAEKIGLQKSLQLINYFYYKTFEPQEYVFQEAQFGDTFYIVVKGTLSIIKDGVGVVNILSQGGSFGEIALTSNNSQRTASVRANEKVTLMIMTKSVYNDFIYSLQYSERLENMKLIKESDFYKLHLYQSKTSEIMQNFGRKTVEKGEHVIKDGDEIASVYFILEGEVRMEKTVSITTVNKWPVSSDKKQKGGMKIRYNKNFLVNTLSRGDCFGAPDLNSIVLSDYDVVANSKTTLIFCYVKERKNLLKEGHISAIESRAHTQASLQAPSVYKVSDEKELIDSIGNIVGGPSSFARCGQENRKTNLQKKFSFPLRSAHPDKLAFEDNAKVQVVNERVYYDRRLYNRSRPNTVTLLCRAQRIEDVITPEATPTGSSICSDNNNNINIKNNNTQQREISLSPLKAPVYRKDINSSRPGTAKGSSLSFRRLPLDSKQVQQPESVIKLSPVKRGLHRSASIDFSETPNDITPLLGFVTETVKFSSKGRRSPQKGFINLDTYSNNILQAHLAKNKIL